MTVSTAGAFSVPLRLLKAFWHLSSFQTFFSIYGSIADSVFEFVAHCDEDARATRLLEKRLREAGLPRARTGAGDGPRFPVDRAGP
jgi:cell shape-determining protein MreC